MRKLPFGIGDGSVRKCPRSRIGSPEGRGCEFINRRVTPQRSLRVDCRVNCRNRGAGIDNLSMNTKLACLGISLASTLFLQATLHAADSPGTQLLNPDFKGPADGIPDSWQAYPPPFGESQKLGVEAAGGVRFTDQDPGNGLGLAQWIEVIPGQQVSAKLAVEGEGTISLNLIFTPKIPGKAAMIGQIAVRTETAYFSAGKQEPIVATVPEAARFLRVFVYCTKPGLCNLVVKSIDLKISGEGTAEAPAKPQSTATTQKTTPATPAGTAAAAVLDLKNPDFTGPAGGLPDSWQAYPPPSGDNQKLGVEAQGGVRFTDQDAENGLGLAQWVAVSPGQKYSASLTVDGPESISLTLIFAPKIPAKIASLKTSKLGEVTKFFSGSKQSPIIVTVPDGAQFMRVIVYSTKPGLIDVVVKSVDIKPADGSTPDTPMKTVEPAAPAQASTTAPAQSTEPAVKTVWATDVHGNPVTKALQNAPDTLPPGTVYGIDFEPGDFSQCHLLEGGKKWVVSAPDPVRNGKHSMKVMMTHDQHRTEVTGPRSAPSGEFKYGWSMFLPETFDGETFFSIVTQWHTWGSGKDYPPDGGPPTSITISKNNWGLKIQHQDGEEFKTTKDVIPFGSILGDKGKWTDFYMEVNWQSPKAGGGYLRLWKNGEKVVDYNGPTWFEEKTKGPFFKMGVYKGGASWKGGEEGTIIFFDEFHMGDKSSTREQIDPAKQPRS